MEFREVTELVPGTKYRIVYQKCLKYTGFYSHIENTVHIFKNVDGYEFNNEKSFAYFVNTLYKPICQRDRIQTMEEHVQLILKQIIGDSIFQW